MSDETLHRLCEGGIVGYDDVGGDDRFPMSALWSGDDVAVEEGPGDAADPP
jgi:hypothetical protein